MNAKFEQVANVTSKATVRMHQVIVDRGIAKGGADQGPSGGEYLLVGLGGCFTSHLLAAIHARKAELSNVRVTANGTMDETPQRFTAFTLEVTAESGDVELGRKLVTIAARGCQVVNTLRRAASISISYNGVEIPLDDPAFVA
ncbi:MAG TPA: OsmC family protein [Gemmatimonadaceae bacterium]